MQKLAEICVHRPVFASMLIAAITVVGGVSFFTLGVDRYPRVETPVVSVTTTNPGATPENMETEVTDRIEAAVNTVSGIDELRSTSTEGRSRVTISFDLSKNADIAAQEVRAKVDPVIRDLPETADPPVVQKQDPDSFPILMFSVSAPMPVVELTTFLEQNVQKRLESVNGVGEVLLFGARRREIQVQIDPDRLNAYGLSTTDVAAALRSQNLELPGGRLEQGNRELSVRTLGRLRNPDAFNDLVVATRGNTAIRIRDIGRVVDTGEEPTSVSMLNGRPALTVAVRKQSGVNTVALADAIKARMAEIQQTLPANVQVVLVRDDSEFIKASLAAIEEHLVLGGILAAIIVLIFLRNFRTTLIAAIAIPTSIIGAFAVIAALDFTLNQMTMLALTLMVGIVIDDAIVVLENIYRFVEEKGMSPFQAAIEGTREIGLAVMATTLALLAVFIPVGFLGGIVGRFMSSFGLTSAAAIAISLIVSFTLTPTLAARWIKPRPTEDSNSPDHSAGDESRRGFYRHIDRTYTALLQWSMAHRWLIVVTCIMVVVSIVPLYRASGNQLHAGRRRITVSDLDASPGRFEHRRDAVARRPRLARRAQEPAGRTGRAGERGTDWRRPGCQQLGQRLRAAEADRRARRLAAGADAAGAQADTALSQGRSHLGAGHRRPELRRRTRGADPVRPGRPGPGEARSVHGQGHGADGEELGPRRRRPRVPAWPARAAPRHRSPARRRSRRPHPGRVADGQCPHRRPGSHDLQRRHAISTRSSSKRRTRSGAHPSRLPQRRCARPLASSCNCATS